MPKKGYKQPEVVRKNNSESKKGAKNHNFGKVTPLETRIKISESLKGYKHSEETRRKLREARKGRTPMLDKHHSEESRLKMSEAQKGNKSHMWNPNLTDEDRLLVRRIYPEYQEWRKLVFERDNYTCQKCRDNKGGNLEAHHIEGYSFNKELRIVVENGITFCKTCHKDFHHQYGNESTAEKVNEFMGRGH